MDEQKEKEFVINNQPVNQKVKANTDPISRITYSVQFIYECDGFPPEQARGGYSADTLSEQAFIRTHTIKEGEDFPLEKACALLENPGLIVFANEFNQHNRLMQDVQTQIETQKGKVVWLCQDGVKIVPLRPGAIKEHELLPDCSYTLQAIGGDQSVRIWVFPEIKEAE